MGHGAPYVAVINLAFLTANYWRVLRRRLNGAGGQDPMGLTSMHALLDFTEDLMEEILANGCKDGKEIKAKITQFRNQLYGPEPGEKLNGDGYKPRPAGFEPENIQASFDVFAKSIQ